MDGCIENGRDLSKGLKYNNFGVHGACSASAADALAAVKKFVFEEKTIEPAELLKALEANYEGYEELRKKLAEEAPKVGNNDDAADEILVKLFDYFADACEAFGENERRHCQTRFRIGYVLCHSGIEDRCYCGRKKIWRILQRKPCSCAWNKDSGPDKRFPVLFEDRLPANMQRRTYHDGAGHGIQRRGIDPKGCDACSDICPAWLPAVAVEQPECTDTSGCESQPENDKI